MIKDDILPNNRFTRYPLCGKCKQPYDAWLERGAAVKALLFWLPLKHYRCRRCNRSYYVLRRSPFV